jgi:hypothetical protein
MKSCRLHLEGLTIVAAHVLTLESREPVDAFLSEVLSIPSGVEVPAKVYG